MHARNFVSKAFLKTHSSFLWPHTGGKGTLQDSVSTTLTLNYLCCNLCPLRGWTVANGPSQGWVRTSMLVLNVQNGYFEWAASVGWGFKMHYANMLTNYYDNCCCVFREWWILESAFLKHCNASSQKRHWTLCRHLQVRGKRSKSESLSCSTQ